MKTVGVCESCGRQMYVNNFGYCKKCSKDLTNEDIKKDEEENQ